MFSFGRPPKLTRDRAGLEFVPIGQRIISPEKGRAQSNNKGVRLTADKIDNTHIESSFDETTNQFDSLGAAEFENLPRSSRSGNAGWNSRGNVSSTLEQKNRIVDGGASSIQELQAESQNLQTENYNLKVEVATLKRFLKQTPPEAQELIMQNAALKQELIKTQNDLADVKKSAENGQDKSQEHELDALKRSYREEMDEKAHDLQRLQRKVAELSQEAAPKIPQEILDKLEFLQNENQALLRQLEGASVASDKNRGQLQSENNDLKLELHRLRAQLAEIPADAAEKLSRLQSTNDSLESKLRSATADLQEAEDERDSMRGSVRNLQMLVDDKQAEINKLSRFTEESKSSQSRTLRETDARLERAQHEIEDLKLKLKRAEMAVASAAEERNSDMQSLQRKLDNLSKELKDKDRDEYSLRAQIRSLMDERNKAFDNQATVQHYQTQIDALREKEKTLFDENLRLKDDITRLQDKMYSHNVDSGRLGKLQQENTDLLNRLDFYEKEYALTQEAMDTVEAELEVLKTEQKRNDNEKHALQTELESLRTKLRRTELRESGKYNESAYMELEENHRKREEAEHRRMAHQIESLNTQIRQLEQQLEAAKRDKDMFPIAGSYQPGAENRLRSDLQSKDFELQEKQREYLKLQNVLKDKEDLIDALEERIRKLNKEFRTDFAAEDRYRDTLQKLKFEHESEILAVSRERDRLQSDLKNYKSKLEMLEDDYTQAENGANSVTIALLQTQLDELRRKNEDLLSQLDRSSSTRFDSTSKEVEEYRAKIRELRFALNDVQQEKSELETTRDTLESDLSLLRSEKGRFETKNRTLSQELTKNARSCTRLADKVLELQSQLAALSKNKDDAFRTQKSNMQLQNQVDQLSSRLASSNINNQPIQTLGVARERLHKNEVKYFKAKLFELQTLYMDLALMNSFMVSSIRNSSQSCKDDLVKMASYGIYPEYSALKDKKKKLTFKVLATFVLGMVRMKRRTEKAKAREVKLAQLRSDIEKDKITLLVEG